MLTAIIISNLMNSFVFHASLFRVPDFHLALFSMQHAHTHTHTHTHTYIYIYIYIYINISHRSHYRMKTLVAGAD
jgi:hypothetical protein